MPTTKDWSLIAGMLLALGVWAGVSTADAQDAENSHRQYCKMITLWHKDAESGVAPELRDGWPPYDGRNQCEQN